MTIAMPARHAPQKMTIHLLGSGRPRWVMVPMTTEAESALVTKKMPMTTMASTEVTAVSGSWSKSPKSMDSAPFSTERSAPFFAKNMAEPPKTMNHRMHTEAGTTSTTVTNWRMVRPREILAMNMPTNGDHESHQAQ